MITVDIQPKLEKDFKEIVQKFYNGDESAAINEAIKTFIQQEKEKNMTWQQRFDRVVNRIRNQVEASGGITEEEIESAIRRVRRRENARHSKGCD
jgi:metal-responsive CopG/Arc/MetJ family transcriptional regulator